MPEMIIRLIPDPETGKKNIIISLRSDEDALPHEHENMHKAVVEKLIGKGILKDGDKVIVERVEDEKEPASPVAEAPKQERQAVQQGR